MTQKTTVAPPGRVYRFSDRWKTSELETWLGNVQAMYAGSERKAAQWCRVNPADLDRFASLWPGCVVAEDAQLKGTIRLGRE